MIKPYQVVGLSPSCRHITKRADIAENINHIERLIRSAMWAATMDVPVRLVTLPEGALQGFRDEFTDQKHEEYALECAIDLPGPETEALSALAVKYDVFLMASAKARHEEFPGRFFNVGFLIDPRGEIILKHHKVAPLQPYERTLTPHNVFDRWVELYGNTLDAFYPVADTEIGRLGFMLANEAAYPENARGLAMNGCEVVQRGPYPNSFYAEIQNRARALDNNMYVIGNQGGPALAPKGSDGISIDNSWRQSMIVDYKGELITSMTHGGSSTFIYGTVNIEELRNFRVTAKWANWVKDLTTEQYRVIYEQEIYPRNLYLDRDPYFEGEYQTEVTDRQINLMIERGVYTKPSEG